MSHHILDCGENALWKSRGVSFLWRKDITIIPVILTCPAWQRLYALRRVHNIRVVPRPGLPHDVHDSCTDDPAAAPGGARIFECKLLALIFCGCQQHCLVT